MDIALVLVLILFAFALLCAGGAMVCLLFNAIRTRERANDLQTQIDNLKRELVEVKGKLNQ